MSTAVSHAMPVVVDAHAWSHATVPNLPIGDEAFVQTAGAAARLMPADVHDALVQFADHGHRSGALLLKGVPVGELPPTPPSPTAPFQKDRTSEFTLLAAARRLGQPVGYEPEHGGDLVQNIVPVPTATDRQVSTSSKVNLMFHTEAAFHPHRPRYLLLICLRGDPQAFTTLASIREVLPVLPERTVEVLFQPRFRTAIDESYLHGRANVLGAPMPVLTGTLDDPTMVFDEDLMVGLDEEAEAALHTLGEAVVANQIGVSLEAGDLLVVDNNVAVHGRTPFTPRFDGTDRWLQRAMVVADLAPSAADRNGRVITTVFGA
ncbi:MAG TPA: L-asparagine oxygenase [Acidimicrobiaceae bacterium]|nr:L-asparagine oxygenase [Acidimicrobiaceae bacterium]